jgi:MFS family permease
VKLVTLLIAFAFLAWELRSFFVALASGPETSENVSVRARPLMFMFLLSWALPISFVPLNAAALPAHLFNIPHQLAMAAPISAEMGSALLTAILAGWLSDRVGWHVPVFLGLGFSFAGALTSYFSPSFEVFVISRALTGLGYGLTWMGIQALVVHHTTSAVMTTSIANITASIFTGYMLGTVAGGFLADAAGFASVFLVGAASLALPAAYAFVFLRAYWREPEGRLRNKRAPAGTAAIGLLRSADFSAVLFACIAPFSIAQVSLLYYAVPVFLNAVGFGTAEIGSVLAMYSAIFVFLAPPIARRIDKQEKKKIFVLAGGLLGSLALSSLYLAPGVTGVVIATAALALASSIGSAAQTSYALQLDSVRSAGSGLATGLQRSADKFGQMLGPLIVGGLYSVTSLPIALAWIGLFYFAATLIFFLSARPADADRPA